METNKLKEIRNLILPILESQDVDLIEMEFRGRSGSQVLRIFVDTDSGITLDQCVNLSREISDRLDIKDLIAGRYRLEVSSPGLDRPLKTKRDFERNIGRKIKITYLVNGAEDKTIIGHIEQIDDDMIVIKEDDQLIYIDLSKVMLAKIMLKW